jgi:DNA-binding MarR family transcriptional regulator
MGSIQDLLEQVPLASVLRERVALADQKYEAALRETEQLKRKVEALERENAELREQISQAKEAYLSDDTKRVLVHLFKTTQLEARDVGAMATALGMERGLLKYHLDRLHEAGLTETTGGNYLHGHVYWALTPAGRRRVVEGKLI